MCATRTRPVADCVAARAKRVRHVQARRAGAPRDANVATAEVARIGEALRGWRSASRVAGTERVVGAVSGDTRFAMMKTERTVGAQDMSDAAMKDDSSAVVYVVDDDPAIRASLDTLLRSLGLRVVTFASTAELRATHRENVTSCLLLDVRLRGESGLVFQQASDRPSIPIVVITGFADVEVCRKALKGGAVDFLVKPFTDHELIDAVNLALSLDAARRVRNDTHDELRQSFELLTRREREVLAYVVSGALNKQIASHLGLSLITIKQHRAAVMRKMNASSLADLVRKSEAIGVQLAT